MIPPAQQEQIATTLEDDAEVMSNAQLEPLLADEPPDVQAEILRINKEARDRSLQVALLVPLLASLLGVAQRVPHETPPGPHAVGSRRKGWSRADACSRESSRRRARPARIVPVRRLRSDSRVVAALRPPLHAG